MNRWMVHAKNQTKIMGVGLRCISEMNLSLYRTFAQTGATWMERIHGPDVLRKPGYRAALIEVAIALNAALTAHGVRQALNIEARGGIDVVYGVYLLDERLVWSPPNDHGDCFRLAPAVEDTSEFSILCDRLVTSPRVGALLDAG